MLKILKFGTFCVVVKELRVNQVLGLEKMPLIKDWGQTDQVTTLANLNHWPIILISNSWQDVVMTHMPAKNQGHRSDSLKARMETKQVDEPNRIF